MEIRYRAELYKILPPESTIVELGVAEGLFSRDMAEWPVTKELYCVDAWQKLDQRGDGGFDQSWHDANKKNAEKLLSKYGEKVKILQGLTSEMAKYLPDQSVNLLYLDADHSYDGVIRDLEAWYPKVVNGGVIATHDYFDVGYGVKKAFYDFTFKNKIFEIHIMQENKVVDAGAYFIKPC